MAGRQPRRDHQRRMSLGDHLAELRRRLFRSAVALVVAGIGGFAVSGFVLDALRSPITELGKAQGRTAMLNYTDVTSAFDLRMQIAFTVGVVASSPIWLYQLWAFVVPALERHERRYAISFVGAAVPLFVAGCVAGWLVLPHMVTLLTSFSPAGTSTILTARDYVNFVLKLMLAVGAAFVLPLLLVLLNAIGVISGRSILRSWRVAIIAIVGFTAIATPAADVMSMFGLAIPMVALFFIAAGYAVLHDRRQLKKLASGLPSPLPIGEV
jgi:sec-independent protein translocase protein TatC